MIELSFKQTSSELMVRASATILFNSLVRHGFPLKPLSELAQGTQYGFTASASQEIEGIKFVRITDLKDGKINWDTVPYCKCDSPDQYMLENGDILFARTGATTGKTHLVKESPKAVFASYLIRLRPKKNVLADYLYYFFQSDIYWKQIIEEKEGSAQPNVNGKKLIKINIPLVPYELQVAISSFLAVIRLRQDGILQDLPELPPPLEEQRRIVAWIEELETAIGEARGLRKQSLEEVDHLLESSQNHIFTPTVDSINLGDVANIIDPNPSHRYPAYVLDGIPLVSTENFLGDDRINIENTKLVSEQFYEDTLGKYNVGETDIIFSRKGKVGYARFYPSCQKIAMTHTLCILQTKDKSRVLPRYLLHFARSCFFIKHLIGTMNPNSGVPTLGLKIIRSAPFKLLELEEQKRIVAYLDDLQAKIDSLKRLQAETAAELDALLPSILDKAFKGEL